MRLQFFIDGTALSLTSRLKIDLVIIRTLDCSPAMYRRSISLRPLYEQEDNSALPVYLWVQEPEKRLRAFASGSESLSTIAFCLLLLCLFGLAREVSV